MWGRVTLAADAVHLGPWQQAVASVPVAAGENSRGVDGIDTRTRSTQCYLQCGARIWSVGCPTTFHGGFGLIR